MMRISTKAQMYKLLEAQCFGNTLAIWHTADELFAAVEAGFDWLVGVRSIGQPGLPYFHHKTPAEAIQIGKSLPYEVRYYEASRDEFIILQGEVTDLPHGYGVEYSRAKTHMRAAFAIERLSEFSPVMPAVIRRSFNEASLEDLERVFEWFPGSTVEFTAYEVCVGKIPGRNVVCWECRHF